MAEGTNPYVNECGACLFDLALDLYDGWMEGLPYVHCRRDGVVVAECQPELIRDVWPTVQQLCVRLEAQGKGDLAARLERAFRDAEDYARLIDNYCQSERFDYHLWAYGDAALDGLHYPEADLETLEAKAREIGEGPLTEDLAFWEHEREWALQVGERAEEIEVEKYGRAPTDNYALRTEMRAWACFWLAAQLLRQGIDHQEGQDLLERYLSSVMCPDEAKRLILREALGRAFGTHIHPVAVLESEEVTQGLEGLSAVVLEIRSALASTGEPEDASKKQPWVDDAPAYLPLSEARKLIDERLSLPTLSKLCRPDGPVRYMRRGRRCKVHLGDFRRHMQSQQSDPEWAKAFLAYQSAAGRGNVRFYWRCTACDYEYPESPAALAECPKCGAECEIFCKRPPEPKR